MRHAAHAARAQREAERQARIESRSHLLLLIVVHAVIDCSVKAPFGLRTATIIFAEKRRCAQEVCIEVVAVACSNLPCPSIAQVQGNEGNLDATLDTVGWQRLLLRSDSMAGVAEDLKRQGVTHLLVGYSIFT